MNKITVTDNRTEKSFDKENMEVSISTALPKTFQTMDEKGDVVEATLNIIQPAQTTTLKDLQAEIDGIKERISTTQTQLDFATKELADKQALFDQMEVEVTTAFEALSVAEPVIDPNPVKEDIPVDVTP